MQDTIRLDYKSEIIQLKNRLNNVEEKLSFYAGMLHSMSTSDIDYIAMETGIDLDQDQEVNTND